MSWSGACRFTTCLSRPLDSSLQRAGSFSACSLGLLTRPESLSGVVGIVVEGGRFAQAGMVLEFGLSLSISLAVLNLLPIPVLDGGQITMCCLEAIFPRLAKLRVPLTLLGLIILAVLMVYSNGNDVVRYWKL